MKMRNLTCYQCSTYCRKNIESKQTERDPNVNKNIGKLWEMWRDVYFNWDNEQFKSKFRLTKNNFKIILNRKEASIVKTPTNLVPEPTEPNTQLRLTIHKLAHSCTFTVISDVYGICESLGTQTFNHVARKLVVNLFDEYVKMSSTEQKWITDIKAFIENYEFTWIGAWDGFHVYVCSKLKNHYNFKQRFSISNMKLVGYNKCFLNLSVRAPGSTHDAKFLRNTGLLKQILNGQGLPDKTIHSGEEYDKIPLVTIGDFRLSWPLKNFNCNTNDERERYYNTKMNSTRVVIENCYGMLKCRWWILHKKAESKVFNLKFIVMAWVILH